MTTRNARLRLLAVLLLASASGCANGGRSTGGSASAPISPTRDTTAEQRAALEDFTPEDVTIFVGATKEVIRWDDLVERAAGADAVILGELHGHPRGLAFTSALFDDILAREPTGAALALEFYERDHQPAIDDYLTGVTSAEEFAAAASRTPGNDPPGHRAMLEAARSVGAPVVAANAPRRYVRLARTAGFDALRALTEEQHRLFVVPESMTTGGYRDRFFSAMGAMGGHSGDDPATETDAERAARRAEADRVVETFFRSQNVWDATMAESVARLLEIGRRPVVLVVGRFHAEFEGGVVSRLRDLSPGAGVLTIVAVDSAAASLADEDRGRGDLVVYIGG